MDLDPEDVFKDEEDDPDNEFFQQSESSKEYVVYLVDASPKMFNTCPGNDQKDEAHFHTAVSCIAGSLKTQIISRSYDEVAICFFYTDLIGLDGEDLAQFMPSASQKLEDMKDQLRKRMFTKRVVRRIEFHIANGLSIELNTYALIRSQSDIRSTIERHKKACSGTSNTNTVTEINAQLEQIYCMPVYAFGSEFGFDKHDQLQDCEDVGLKSMNIEGF